MEIGKVNELVVKSIDSKGYVLIDKDEKEIFLPHKETQEDFEEASTISVFIYTDSQGNSIATTKTSKIELGTFEHLKIVENSSIGAFADWGLTEDLLIPFADQDFDLLEGKEYIVYLYLDKISNRLRGSTVFYEQTETENIEVTPGDEVTLLVCEHSDLGITVIIDNKYEGLLYNDEVYDVLEVGQKVQGYVKKVREDNKIDVTLQKFGYRNVEPNAQKILDTIQKKDGFLGLNDKSDPEVIKAQMKMSKKTFKKALGALYKQRLIRIETDGIYII